VGRNRQISWRRMRDLLYAGPRPDPFHCTFYCTHFISFNALFIALISFHFKHFSLHSFHFILHFVALISFHFKFDPFSFIVIGRMLIMPEPNLIKAGNPLARRNSFARPASVQGEGVCVERMTTLHMVAMLLSIRNQRTYSAISSSMPTLH